MRLVPYRSVEPLCRLTGSARSRVVSNGVGLGVGGPNCGWTPDGHCCEPRPSSGSAEDLPPHGGRHFTAIQQIRLIAVALCFGLRQNPLGQSGCCPVCGPERSVSGASRKTGGSGPSGNAKYGPHSRARAAGSRIRRFRFPPSLPAKSVQVGALVRQPECECGGDRRRAR